MMYMCITGNVACQLEIEKKTTKKKTTGHLSSICLYFWGIVTIYTIYVVWTVVLVFTIHYSFPRMIFVGISNWTRYFRHISPEQGWSVQRSKHCEFGSKDGDDRANNVSSYNTSSRKWRQVLWRVGACNGRNVVKLTAKMSANNVNSVNTLVSSLGLVFRFLLEFSHSLSLPVIWLLNFFFLRNLFHLFNLNSQI